MAIFSITRLEVTNIRNFESSAFSEFAPQKVNLIVGANSSGKTSLLSALRIAVGAFFADQRFVDKVSIEEEDLRIRDGIYLDQETSFVATGQIADVEVSWSRSRAPGKGKTTTIGLTSQINGQASLKELVSELLEDINHQDPQRQLPLICYQSCSRLSLEKNAKPFNPKIGRWNGYHTTLSLASNKAYITDWLWKTLATQQSKGDDLNDSEDQILSNLIHFLRKSLIFLGILEEDSDFSLYYDLVVFNDLMIKWNYMGQTQHIPISSLSDGTKNIVWLMIELVWRASILNPKMGREAVSLADGVVLIDEIDQHLHPKWQSKIVGCLQHVFPNVQFFITTHSPNVISNLRDGKLFVINGQTLTEMGSFYGQDVNTIQEDLQSATIRPPEVTNQINQFETLVGERDFRNKDYLRLKEDLIGILGDLDPIIVRASTLEQLFARTVV